MTFYQSIAPIGEPHDLGIGANDRQQVVFNIEVIKTPSETLEEELIKILTDAKVGVFGTDIFSSTGAQVPTTGPAYLVVTGTGGFKGLKTQNKKGSSYPRPSAQILASGATFKQARAKAFLAYNALDQISNQEVTLP